MQQTAIACVSNLSRKNAAKRVSFPNRTTRKSLPKVNDLKPNAMQCFKNCSTLTPKLDTFTLDLKLKSWEVRMVSSLTVSLGFFAQLYGIHSDSGYAQVCIKWRFRLQGLQEDTSLKRRKIRVLARLASAELVWNLKHRSKHVTCHDLSGVQLKF